ncbi:glycosyltransferase [Apibacter sp. ESL0432]|uniref:glycosyltransferase n=1 Tax=Apibacter sp. ESL0432 TaxID=2704652 RepID=UPI001C6A6714|nr:glycosyltransferase [Apibacter sp. ESL0432]QYN49779.1 glycosyltransferase [Apibacter sp. ESL0432]
MDKELPLVSIVAINYNNSKHLVETLDSIDQQTYKNIELIIVDDCSTDDSVKKIDQWLLTYNKPFQFIKHTENKGICKTINDGYKVAKGKYISSIATDDLMLPKKTEIQVQLLENTDDRVGMVFSDAFLIDENSSPIESKFIEKYKSNVFHINSENIYEDLLKGNFIPAMSIMIKSKIFSEIGYFDESLNYEDYDMWLRIAEIYKVHYSDYISAKYRIHNSSFTQVLSRDKWVVDDIKIYNKHKNKSPIAQRAFNYLIKDSFIKDNKNLYKYLKSMKINKRITIMCKIWGINALSHKNKIKLYEKSLNLISFYYKLQAILSNKNG